MNGKAGVSNKPDVAGKRGACAVGAGAEAGKRGACAVGAGAEAGKRGACEVGAGAEADKEMGYGV